MDAAGRHTTVRLRDYILRGIQPEHKTLPWQEDVQTRQSEVTIKLKSGRRSAAKLLTKDEARRIAANVAKLPEIFCDGHVGTLDLDQ